MIKQIAGSMAYLSLENKMVTASTQESGKYSGSTLFSLGFLLGNKVMGLKVKVKVAWLCPSLCDLKDYAVHGVLQARILEWVAIPFSRGSSQPRDRTQVSNIAGGFFTG